MKWKDPIVEEVHEIRRQMMAEFGNDFHKLREHLCAKEEEHPERYVTVKELKGDRCGRGRVLDGGEILRPGMNLRSLHSQVTLGEDSTRQFKADVHNAESLAAEMAAFANTNGGTIFIGVADDGSTPGLAQEDVLRINQLIGNAASHLVRSPLTVQTENVALKNGRIAIVLSVPKGIDKPYFDKNGVIWLKTGADKRRVNSKEELRRLFQMSSQFHAGNSNIRNPILVSYIAKGMLPYHGLGSGIKRALEKWPDIAFTDDHDGCLFTATVHRKPVGELALAADSPAKRRKSVGKDIGFLS